MTVFDGWGCVTLITDGWGCVTIVDPEARRGRQELGGTAEACLKAHSIKDVRWVNSGCKLDWIKNAHSTGEVHIWV